MFPDRDLTDRDRTIDLVLSEARTAAGPLVLVVDDAHWADDASLDVIRFVGRRLPGASLLLVVAFRPHEVGTDHGLRRVLGALTGPDVSRLDLRPLSGGAVRQLAAAAGVPYERVSDLGGNPFLVSEVLAAPQPEVPASVRDAFLALESSMPRGRRTDLHRRILHGLDALAVDASVSEPYEATPSAHASPPWRIDAESPSGSRGLNITRGSWFRVSLR